MVGPRRRGVGRSGVACIALRLGPGQAGVAVVSAFGFDALGPVLGAGAAATAVPGGDGGSFLGIGGQGGNGGIGARAGGNGGDGGGAGIGLGGNGGNAGSGTPSDVAGNGGVPFFGIRGFNGAGSCSGRR